jgi:LacI family transcriptional regulator
MKQWTSGGAEVEEVVRGTARKPTLERAPTLQDVAERAGVSKMSASLVLNGSRSNTRVSEATRQRIRRAAEDIGYHPNAVARSLSRRQTNVIAVCLDGFRTPRGLFFSELLAGMHEGCHDHGKDLLFHGTFRDRSTDDAYAGLVDGRIDGLILFARATDPLAERLAQTIRLPVVAVVDAIPGVPSVVADDATGGALMAERLHAGGHRFVAFVQREEPPESVVRRHAAFRAEATRRGMTVREIRLSGWMRETPETLATEIMKPQTGDGRPTAVAFWADPSAEIFLRQCARLGVRVPRDLAVIGYDGTPESHDLTTVVAPWAEVARTAVGLLVARINGEEVPPETVLPVVLREGVTA